MKNYVNKFNSLDELGKFIVRHKLPKLTQGEVETLNTPAVICFCLPGFKTFYLNIKKSCIPIIKII